MFIVFLAVLYHYYICYTRMVFTANSCRGQYTNLILSVDNFRFSFLSCNIGCQPGDFQMDALIFLSGLGGYVWVNILTGFQINHVTTFTRNIMTAASMGYLLYHPRGSI